MGRIESFASETDLLGRIEHLKLNGVREEQMTVVTNESLEGTKLEHLNVNTRSTEVDTWDRVVAWFADEDPETQVMNSMQLTPEEQEEYKSALKDGKLLLHIDERTGSVDEKPGAPSSNYTYRDEDTRAAGHRTADLTANRSSSAAEETMQLHEERLNIDKQNVKVGEVGIDKHVVTELQEFDVPVDREEVTVDRLPVEGSPTVEAYSRDDSDDEEGVMRIPLTEERIRIVKEKVVTEEIVIRKNIVTDKEHISEEVRREEVDITETDNNSVRYDDRRR
ncbi:DUF2382 domain-containing protein [Salinicoccus hispanicus]|uniref:DUF2382 domain-containing protein n=1 Tax=Salinicoccus hispanicus TaxID=157225 RepID=A0A6N8U3Q7_9STAP|nr:DUF2382 domain-containing protein [Salinicoccus hispanicus]MXQ51075.1 DUF2382 domain-containing protein [Salinicoccus hispanicus]